MGLLIGLPILLTSCGSSTAPGGRAYRPEPDRTLFAHIAMIPHVTRVDLGYADRFGSSNAYSGTVYVDAQADPKRVLDRVLAILWQGHPDAGLEAVQVQPAKGAAVSVIDLGLDSPAALRARYGPQPGPGTPPATPPG